MDKQTLDYVIPIQDEEKMEEINKSLGTNFKSTEWHIDDLINKIYGMIEDTLNEGGSYIGDFVTVKIEMQYNPEDK